MLHLSSFPVGDILAVKRMCGVLEFFCIPVCTIILVPLLPVQYVPYCKNEQTETITLYPVQEILSILLAVLCGELPFDDSNLVTLYRKIQVVDYESSLYCTPCLLMSGTNLEPNSNWCYSPSFVQRGIYHVPAGVSASARDLIGQMLQVDPRRRITVRSTAAHSWTTGDLPLVLELGSSTIKAHALPDSPRLSLANRQLLSGSLEGFVCLPIVLCVFY